MANMEYMNKYEKENIRQIRLKINRKTEPEMIEWIEKQENIQGYIKRLIREDMEKQIKKAKICIGRCGACELTLKECREIDGIFGI